MSSSSSSSSLPPGWENRSNSMSEKDIKLGGIAATKFGNKNIINTAYSDTTTIQEAVAVYKTSDEVRDVYLKQMDIQQKQQQQANNHNNTNTNTNTENNNTKYDDEDETIRTNANNANNANAANNQQTTTPLFWEERQKTRQLEAEGYRNKDNNNNKSNNNSNTQNSSNSNSKTDNSTIAKSSANNTNSNNNAKLALLRIAIHTLETLADTFEQEQEQIAHTQTVSTAITIPMEDKTAFAKAIQRSMQALATTASASSTD